MFGVHHPHHLEVWFKRLPFYCAGYLKLAVCRRLEGPQLLFLVWDWFISTLMRTMQVHGMVAMKVLHVFTDSVRSTLRRYIHTYIHNIYVFIYACTYIQAMRWSKKPFYLIWLRPPDPFKGHVHWYIGGGRLPVINRVKCICRNTMKIQWIP